MTDVGSLRWNPRGILLVHSIEQERADFIADNRSADALLAENVEDDAEAADHSKPLAKIPSLDVPATMLMSSTSMLVGPLDAALCESKRRMCALPSA